MPTRVKVVFKIALFAITGLFIFSPAAKAQSVMINEVLINGPGGCDGACMPNTEEWIELYNPTCSPVDISCYRISDGDFAITIPSGSVIPAQGYFLIGSTNSPVGTAVLDLNIGTCGCTNGPVNEIGVFGNSNEQLVLTNATGTILNAIMWGTGQGLPATVPASAVGTCAATTVNLPVAASPTYENIGAAGSGGCTKARSTDGSLTWTERCTTAITPRASNNTGPAPVVTVLPATAAVCQGQSVSLTASGSFTNFSWSPAAGLSSVTGSIVAATPTVTTTYTVHGVTSAGCLSGTFATSTITVQQADNANFTYGAASFCKSAANPVATAAPGVTGTFSGTANGPVSPPGLILNSTTGEINLGLSATGSYTITFTTSGSCSAQSTQTVSIVAPASACFSYPAQSYCQNGTNPSPTSCTGTGFGTFSSQAGLSFNSTTGVINLASSLPGTYRVYNTIAASGPCAAVVDSVEVEILPVPAVPVATSNSPVCSGSTLQLSIANPDALASYAWTGPGTPAFSSTAQNPSVTNAQTNNSGIYSVTATVG
ncbi:MAG: lamin tail domain-containing protein, partial [Sphingobacteriales bacterium]